MALLHIDRVTYKENRLEIIQGHVGRTHYVLSCKDTEKPNNFRAICPALTSGKEYEFEYYPAKWIGENYTIPVLLVSYPDGWQDAKSQQYFGLEIDETVEI